MFCFLFCFFILFLSILSLSPDISFPFHQLRELQDKYAECMEMLHEAQEELKNLRNKTLPLGTSRRFHSLGLFPMVSSYSWTYQSAFPCFSQLQNPFPLLFCLLLQDSLAAEIEGTMRKELQMDDPDVEEQRYRAGKQRWNVVSDLVPTSYWNVHDWWSIGYLCHRVSPDYNQSECSRQWKTWTWCVSVHRSPPPPSTSQAPTRHHASPQVAPAGWARHAATPYMVARKEVGSSWTTGPAVSWRVQMMGTDISMPQHPF